MFTHEMFNRTKNGFLEGHDEALRKALGGELPAELRPDRVYRGAPRLIVPTARSVVAKGESLKLKIIALPATQPIVHFRPLGKGEWKEIPATHIARAVYEAKLPVAQDDFEYYVTAGKKLVWPATAPQMNQTVIVTDAPTPDEHRHRQPVMFHVFVNELSERLCETSLSNPNKTKEPK